MKCTIELDCIKFRELLSDEDKVIYDDMCNYFVDHHYDEDNPLDKLMLDYAATRWPAVLVQFIRQQAATQYITLDTKLRVQLEYLELEEKIDKLSAFLDSDKSKSLPVASIEHLKTQLSHMANYAMTLNERLTYDFKEVK